MQSFLIEGGRPLQGTITPQGAKNEALEVICAAILTTEEVRISNVPDILDVNNLILLLEDIGVKVTRHARNDYSFKADELTSSQATSLCSNVLPCVAACCSSDRFWDALAKRWWRNRVAIKLAEDD